MEKEDDEIKFKYEDEGGYIRFIEIKGVEIPIINEILLLTDATLLFKGEFKIDDTVMPIERIVILGNEFTHIEIFEKETINYTNYEKDNDNNKFILNQKKIIKLKFREIDELYCSEKLNNAEKRIIKLEEDIKIKNEPLLQERLKYEQNMRDLFYGIK